MREQGGAVTRCGYSPGTSATVGWGGIVGAIGMAGVFMVACGEPERASAGPTGISEGGEGGGAGRAEVAAIGEYVPDQREAPPDDLVWERCPLIPGEAVAAAECATTQLPLDWQTPRGPTIDVSVKRYRRVGRPRGQLWLLNGGPGASGEEFVWLLEYFLEGNPELEVYLPDHRGTGDSSRLSCSTEDTLYELDEDHGARVESCLAELAALYPGGIGGFSVSGAARDLGELVERTRHSDEPVYLYGVSYGTVWAQRYLQLYPSQPSGVILDSICAPGECLFAQRYDRLFDETGKALLALCDERSACARELGADARQSLDELLDALDAGHCSETGLTRAGLRQLLAEMLRSVGVRDLIPAVIARARRCSAEDVAALQRLSETLIGEALIEPTASNVLGVNILVSEFMESPLPSRSDAQAALSGLGFSRDVGPALIALAEIWPRYTRDLVEIEQPASSAPMLMLIGGLDPQTPQTVAQRTLDHFQGQHQTAIFLPMSGHAALVQSPIGDALNPATCGERLVAQFLADPAAEVDASCVDQVAELDFEGVPAVTSALFGTDDAWLGLGLRSTSP